MNSFEMEGFLHGKCLPGDMKVNENNTEYLVRKFSELEQRLIESERYGRQTDITIDNLELKLAQMAAENAGLKAAKEIIRHLNVNREEANFCGIDDCYIDDAVAAMITPATDAFLAEVRAQGVESLSDAVKSVIAERQRQQSVEGWTTARDDEYEHGELADAAGCYALSSELFDCVGEPPRQWPWPDEWWKPSMRRRDLVKAGALILAEIERLDRHELSSIQKGAQS